MPNLSPEVLGSFWNGPRSDFQDIFRGGITVEEWDEGGATLIHPDVYLNEVLQPPKRFDARWEKVWHTYLVLDPGPTTMPCQGDIRVEEDIIHSTFRVTGTMSDGRKIEKSKYYGKAPDTMEVATTKHREKSKQLSQMKQANLRRKEAFEAAIKYARHVATNMTNSAEG